MKINQGFGFIKSHSSYGNIKQLVYQLKQYSWIHLYNKRSRDVAISWAKHANLTYDNSIDFMLDFNSCIEWAQTNSELPDHM